MVRTEIVIAAENSLSLFFIVRLTNKDSKTAKNKIIMRRCALARCVSTASFVSAGKQSDELAKRRATVTITDKVKPESMTSFKDVRPPPPNETDASMRRRLTYQSRYRGMVEMDIIFGSFAKAKLQELSAAALSEYDTLLRQYDNDLFNWLVMGKAPPSDIASLEAWSALETFVKQNRKELLGHEL